MVDRRLTAMFARPELYRTSFDDVAHWVPQFMWMTMYLQRGAP